MENAVHKEACAVVSVSTGCFSFMCMNSSLQMLRMRCVCQFLLVEFDDMSDRIYLHQCQDVFIIIVIITIIIICQFRMAFCNTQQSYVFSQTSYSINSLPLRFTLYLYVCLMLILYCTLNLFCFFNCTV